jgi:hypothetical protein
MYSRLLLENLIAPSQTLAKNVPVGRGFTFKYSIENMIEDEANKIFSQTMQDIDENIITPILQTDLEGVKNKFKSLVFPFELKFEILNRLFFKGKDEKNLPEIIILASDLFENFKNLINNVENLTPEYRERIFDIIDRLKNYNIAMFGFIIKNPDRVTQALKVIKIDSLRENISSMALGFFCILKLLTYDQLDTNKLMRFIEITVDSLEVMEALVDSIDILSKQEESHFISIEGDIGTVEKTGFTVDLNKMENEKKYLVNYSTSQYEVQKNEKDELVVKEVG